MFFSFSIVRLPTHFVPDCFDICEENTLYINANLSSDHVLYAYQLRQDFQFFVDEKIFPVKGLAGLQSRAFKDALSRGACLIRLRKMYFINHHHGKLEFMFFIISILMPLSG